MENINWKTCVVLCVIAFIVGAYFMKILIETIIKNKIKKVVEATDPIEILKSRKDEINESLCYGTGFLTEYGYKENLFPIKSSCYSQDVASFLMVLCENTGMKNCNEGNIPVPDGFSYELLTVPSENPVYGAIFYDSNSKTLFLIWSGTSDSKMIEEDSNTVPVYMPGTDQSDNIKVHRGFLNVYTRVKKQDLVERLNSYDYDQLVIAGNSLGGGLTYISCYDLLSSDSGLDLSNSNVALYTFGSPRAGNIQFAASYEKDEIASNIICNIRIFNTEDIVPDVPPAAPLVHYTHVGTPIPFTYNAGTVVLNHIPCYMANLPSDDACA